jgi:hypothetical protein
VSYQCLGARCSLIWNFGAMVLQLVQKLPFAVASRARAVARSGQIKSFRSLAASGSLFFACAKKSNPKKHPPVWRSPGILPCESASVLRGSLNVHPAHAANWRASCAPPYGLSSAHSPPPQGPPLAASMPQKHEHKLAVSVQWLHKPQSFAPPPNSKPSSQQFRHWGKASVAGPRVSLGYFSLHEQREVTRSSAGRVKAPDLARDLALTVYFPLHEQRAVTCSSAGRVKARDLELFLAHTRLIEGE